MFVLWTHVHILKVINKQNHLKTMKTNRVLQEIVHVVSQINIFYAPPRLGSFWMYSCYCYKCIYNCS